MSPTRADRLAEYIDETSRCGAFWAQSNCLLFPGRWAALERPEIDVSAWLGAVGGALEAARLARSAGGLEVFAAARATEAGLEAIDPASARLGDIGLFVVPRPNRRIAMVLGGIRGARRWAIRSRGGVAMLNEATLKLPPAAVWRV